MTNTNNNNLPKTETIYEIKNEIPTFEEFMKTYQTDGNLNYDDLGSWDIGRTKGYGPAFTEGSSSSSSSRGSCRNYDSDKYEIGGYGAWKKGLTEQDKKELERERQIRSERRGKESTGEKVTKGLMVGFATAALGPVGSIAVGTGLLMVGSNVSDEVAEIGFDTVASGVSDGIVSIAKKFFF